MTPTETKASTILYVSSIVFATFGCLMTLLDMIQRSLYSEADTLVELWAWNPWSEWGLILCGLALYHFLLGRRVDQLDS